MATENGRTKTMYLVFGLIADEGTFVQLGEAEANDSRAAIKAVLPTLDEQEGVFVAVPKRSWKLETVAPKQAFSFS